jgi:uncharacterized protein YjbJ (UPF0337 family)
MNKDQLKGTAKNIAGKVQEEAGKAVGSTDQQIKGLSKQISGKVQKTIGYIKSSIKNSK